jgi:prepilin-type N-terminal cleavage/methylation domain-containing protein
MNKKTRSGFTLPEVLLAITLSVMVFAALGTLLSRSFSIWYDGMAQWKLATHARVTRIRLLDGGFGKGTGLLSSTNHTLHTFGGYEYVQYNPVKSGEIYQCFGWVPTITAENVWLYNEDSAVTAVWAYGQSVKNLGAEAPDVKVSGFSVELSEDNVLEMSYMLRSTAAGKTFEQPQTIRVVLLNSE